MTKVDWITKLADNLGVSKKEAERIHASYGELVASVVKSGEKVPLDGIGAISMKLMSERKGHNPRTKEEITIPARNVLRLLVSHSAKEYFNS